MAFIAKEHLLSTSLSERTNVPEEVGRVADLMSGYTGTWSLCGGWAVDAWLGRVTREHGDIDVSVFADDQRALFEHLDGWQLLAHDATWEPNDSESWWDGRRPLSAPAHIHARPPELSGSMPKGGIATAEDGFSMEFYIDALLHGGWLLNKEPPVTLPLERAIRLSPWGVPTLAPEALLFYKSKGMRIRLRDHLDFVALLPHLSGEQRNWLRGAIALVGHPWLVELSRLHSDVPELKGGAS
jgi:hypothetical protein